MQNVTIRLTFLPSEFIETVLMTFVDTTSITYIISLHKITEVSAILFNYLIFSQVLEFKL